MCVWGGGLLRGAEGRVSGFMNVVLRCGAVGYAKVGYLPMLD